MVQPSLPGTWRKSNNYRTPQTVGIFSKAFTLTSYPPDLACSVDTYVLYHLSDRVAGPLGVVFAQGPRG